MEGDGSTSQNAQENADVFLLSAPIVSERQPQKVCFPCWPAVRVLLTTPDRAGQDSAGYCYLSLMLERSWRVAGQGGEGADYRNKVRDRGHLLSVLENPGGTSGGA